VKKSSSYRADGGGPSQGLAQEAHFRHDGETAVDGDQVRMPGSRQSVDDECFDLLVELVELFRFRIKGGRGQIELRNVGVKIT